MPLTDIITPQWVKDRYLVGVNLTTPDGTAFPDEMFEIAIENAIEVVEDDIDIVFDAESVVGEKQDTFSNVNNFPNFAPIRLRKRPIREITALEAKWGQNGVLEVPLSWCNLDNDTGGMSLTGQLTVIPTQQQLQATSYGLTFWPWANNAPLWWRISYEAGWADPADVPKAFLNVIGLQAAIFVLAQAGDLVTGLPGVSNKSTSIDGMSTSLSAMGGGQLSGFGARQATYQKQFEMAMYGLKRKYLVREMAAL